MLAIRYQSSFSFKKMLLVIIIVALVAAGLYGASLFFSPAIAHAFFVDPINVKALPTPKDGNNRLVVPKLGINISYATPASALTQDAQWRESSLGNPADGGTMILVAHRLSIQPTPEGTISHSPFYALDTMSNNDKIIIDYNGVRYGYQITSVHSGGVSDTSIPTDSADAHLVLYTYDAENDAQRTVIIARPLGKVAL